MANSQEPDWLDSLVSHNSKSNHPIDFSKSLFADSAPRSTVVKLIELVFFALAVPVLGRFLFPLDPVGLHSGFAWLAILPTLFAARYGLTWGLACASLACSTLWLPDPSYADSESARIVLAVGMLVLSIVIGDVTTSWRRSSRQAQAENSYLRHRLKEFSNDYHVLKVSHGQLEEYMAGQRLSLRYALQKIKPVLDSEPDGLSAGAELMAIFAQFCSIQIAGLYEMKSDSTIDPLPIAVHGDMMELPVFDRLLNLALKERQLASVKLDAMKSDQHANGLLAVVPIVDSQEQIHGVLAVSDMHFMAFQQDNLNILSLLGRYIGDLLARSDGFNSSQGDRFASELDSALRYASTHSIASSLVCIDIKATANVIAIAEKITSNVRSLDCTWEPPGAKSHHTVVILLPLINATSCAAYIKRMVKLIETEFDLTAQDWLEQIHIKHLSPKDTRTGCFNFISASTGMVGNQMVPSGEDDEHVQIVA